MFTKFEDFILNEGRKSLLSDEERNERDVLFKLGKKKRTIEQEKKFQELLLKSSKSEIIENPVEPFKEVLKTEYDLEDIVDISKLDLKSEYDKMSNLLYDKGIYKELLMNIPIDIVKRKNENAFVSLVNNKPIKLSFSDFYKVSYKRFLGTLAHETIHIYQGQKNLGLREDSHGRTFQYFMNLINKENLGFEVGIKGTNRSTSEVAKEDDLNYFLYPVYFVNKNPLNFDLCMIFKDEKFIELLKNDVKTINGIRNDCSANKIIIYKTKNPYFNKFRISRSFSASNIIEKDLKISFNDNLKKSAEVLEEIDLTHPYTKELDAVEKANLENNLPTRNLSMLVWKKEGKRVYSLFKPIKDLEGFEDNFKILFNYGKLEGLDNFAKAYLLPLVKVKRSYDNINKSTSPIRIYQEDDYLKSLIKNFKYKVIHE